MKDSVYTPPPMVMYPGSMMDPGSTTLGSAGWPDGFHMEAEGS